MKKRKLLIVIGILCLSLGLLSACGLIDTANDKLGNDTGVKVEKIEIADSDIILAPSGMYGEKQLEPVVLPQNASNKKLSYKIIDAEASSYLIVNSEGLIRALGNEIPDEKYYKIRISSVQDPAVFCDVRVTVMTAEVKRISFGSLTEIVIEVGDLDGYTVNPIITPFYAVMDNNLTYEITREVPSPGQQPLPIIAQVSSSGVITPVAAGHTSLRVEYRSYSGKVIDAFIPVKVVYPPLNYRLKARVTSESIYKQMEGTFESFYIDVTKNDDDPCDPNPQVTWYLNGAEIPNSSDFRGKLSVLIEPHKLGMNRGTHNISVKLESLGQKEQILSLDPIIVYAPLQIFNLTKLTDKTNFSVGDIVSFRATHANNEYPPDKYSWYYIDQSKSANEVYIGETLPNDGYGALNFTLQASGEYHIVCYPVIKSNEQETLRREIYLGTVGKQAVIPGEDIVGTYVDGAIVEGKEVAYIKWDALAYNSGYSVYIKSAKDDIQLESSNPAHKQYFTGYGVYVPTSVATLEDNFTYKIKSSKYEYSKEFSYTGGTIRKDGYAYLDKVHLDYNNYIVNLEELGELLNYISIFRPSEYSKNKSGSLTEFELSLYIPIQYEEIKHLYNSNLSYNKDAIGDEARRINVINLISTASASYCDTSMFEISVSLVESGSDAAKITLTYPNLITSYYDTDEYYDKQDYTYLPHYAENLYGFSATTRGDTLPIDQITRVLEVVTSNQLYYAVSLGYKPLPQAGSAAEDVYNQARAILKRIIRDNMTDAQKVHAIYDFLTVDLVYDYALASIEGSLGNPADIYRYKGFYLEGVFRGGERGKAVCDGIAKAFLLLCRMEGITAKKLGGEAGEEGNRTGHAWNMVFIDNAWYLCDATWGNQLSANNYYEFQTHNYLLAPVSEFADHYAQGRYPTASSKRYNVLTNTFVAENTKPHLQTVEDVDNIALFLAEYVDENGFVWIELYIEPAAGGNDPANYHNKITELIREKCPELSVYKFTWYDLGGDEGYRMLHIGMQSP